METLRDTPFYYLRHGETDWNARGLSQGRVEVALNEAGLAQASAAAAALAGRGIGSIVCSTLGRARQTAAIVAAALGLACSFDPALQEAAFGAQEGKPLGAWYDDWVAGRYTPEGGETFAQLGERVVPAVNRALAQPGAVLIVAHGAMFRALRAAMGLSPLVRAQNGVAQRCLPGQPWVLTDVGLRK